jgi:hypothetical protein
MAEQLLAVVEDGKRRSFQDETAYLVPRGSAARPRHLSRAVDPGAIQGACAQIRAHAP